MVILLVKAPKRRQVTKHFMSDLRVNKYEHPPVIERVLGALTKVDADMLVKQREKWREIVKNDFPREEITTEWKLNIQEVNGVPLIDKAHPIMRLFYRYWFDNAENKPVLCAQARPDGFFINIRREPDNTHSFDEIYEKFQKWLPQWAECFGVQSFDGTILHYVNELSEEITPQFISEDRAVMVGKALRVFGNFNEHFPNLIPPYDCRATMRIPEAPNTTLSIHSKGVNGQNKSAPVVRVEITVKTNEISRITDLSGLFSGCTKMHDILMDGFRDFFTAEAITSFGKK